MIRKQKVEVSIKSYHTSILLSLKKSENSVKNNACKYDGILMSNVFASYKGEVIAKKGVFGGVLLTSPSKEIKSWGGNS